MVILSYENDDIKYHKQNKTDEHDDKILNVFINKWNKCNYKFA